MFTSRQNSAMKIIDTPRMFSTSTFNKSVHGDLGYPSTNSCTRKRNPSPRISAPRKTAVLKISVRDLFFRRRPSVTNAKETPERNKNIGAGKVDNSCDQRYSSVLRASGFN